MVGLGMGSGSPGRTSPGAGRAVAGSEPFSFDQIVGASESLREAIATARMVARAKLTTVLLVGETGTGKELFARAVRSRHPLRERQCLRTVRRRQLRGDPRVPARIRAVRTRSGCVHQCPCAQAGPDGARRLRYALSR
jgi:MoxR-like ATPase